MATKEATEIKEEAVTKTLEKEGQGENRRRDVKEFHMFKKKKNSKIKLKNKRM